jgi:hypothetical protein
MTYVCGRTIHKLRISTWHSGNKGSISAPDPVRAMRLGPKCLRVGLLNGFIHGFWACPLGTPYEPVLWFGR